MKLFNQNINFKKILLTLLLLALASISQIFILFMFRKYGDLNFYDIEHHIFVYVNYLISLVSTLVAWRLTGKKHNFIKTVKTFLLACVLYYFCTFFLDLATRFIAGGTKSITSIFVNTGALTVIFHLYVSGFVLTFLHFKQSQQTAITLAQTEKEKATLQSQILQKNLEPHFLFNNLSVLSGLAIKKPEQIEDFIDDFSDVYRYYLKHGKKQLVELKDELSFLKSYMNLMEKRFGKAYQINNKIEDPNGFVVPCSLQLCIENAIKHNKANEENPLLISLLRKESTIIIKNKLNKVDFTLGTGTGNDYLQRQYQINFGKDVVFTETYSEFVVEIPLIQ